MARLDEASGELTMRRVNLTQRKQRKREVKNY